jgi:transposase
MIESPCCEEMSGIMLAETQDEEQIIARVAAIDIGKAELVCCVRVPAPRNPKKRLQEVSTHSTMSHSLAELANHLVELRIERVVMEATSDYWRPVFYLLEAHGLEPWLVNARDVKHLPGRPKTDVLDSVWLCRVAERQMLRPSFVPAAPIRRLRDLTRYRIDLVRARTAEKNRVEKLLEDACIKLSVVASDIFRGVGACDDGCAHRRRTQPCSARTAGTLKHAHEDQPTRGCVHGPLR